MLNTEMCCGAVVFTIQNGETYYLLIKSPDNIIGFPKGHMEEGESEIETALREIYEETSLKVNITDSFKETIQYKLPNGNKKKVTYFLAEYKNQIPIYNECLLLKYDDAMNLLSYDNTKTILKKSKSYIENGNLRVNLI